MANPLSADHIAASQGGFEPQRKNNFVMEFGVPNPDDAEVLRLSVKAGFLPNVENDDITIPWGNEERYVAGKAKFAAGTVMFHDYVDQRTKEALMTWRRQVYNEVNGAIGLAAFYKREVRIIQFGPDGTILKTWKLVGCFPRKLNPGEADYSSGEANVIEVEFRYDKAVPDFIDPAIGIQNALA